MKNTIDLIMEIGKTHTEIYMTKLEIKTIKEQLKEQNKMKSNIELVEPPKKVVKVEVETKDQDFEDEVEFYYSNMREKDQNHLIENIDKYLPSKQNYQYKSIVRRLQLEYLKELKELTEWKKEETDSKSIKELQEETTVIKKIIKILNDKTNEEEILTEEDKIENQLILVPTSSGNIRVLQEIEDIPYEFLNKFKGLFDSIKNGTFKNIKRFDSNNNILEKMLEVKDYQVRVVFDKLSEDKYAIISMFIKKCDNDKGYRTSLGNSVRNYKNIKDKLKEKINDEEFINIQEMYVEELYNKLSQSENKIELKKGE